MLIRQITKQDLPEVLLLIEEAFRNDDFSSKDEHLLVERLFDSSSYIKELSLAAIENNEIIGYILFTKITLGNTSSIALAPLVVKPNKQNSGIGSKLINEAHKIAKSLDYDFSICLGHDSYYKKFGYIPASTFKISAPFEVEDKYFMAINLSNKFSEVNDIVVYAKEFQI